MQGTGLAAACDALTLAGCVCTDIVDAWVLDLKQHGPAHTEALSRLVHMNLFVREAPGAGPSPVQACTSYRLHPMFQAKLRWALSTG